MGVLRLLFHPEFGRPLGETKASAGRIGRSVAGLWQLPEGSRPEARRFRSRIGAARLALGLAIVGLGIALGTGVAWGQGVPVRPVRYRRRGEPGPVRPAARRGWRRQCRLCGARRDGRLFQRRRACPRRRAADLPHGRRRHGYRPDRPPRLRRLGNRAHRGVRGSARSPSGRSLGRAAHRARSGGDRRGFRAVRVEALCGLPAGKLAGIGSEAVDRGAGGHDGRLPGRGGVPGAGGQEGGGGAVEDDGKGRAGLAL